ncbi:hypothetical protein [Algiphilus sp.]|uniref:hypothetical protein n=1 Tax=Algiphilus sp. TaxID=1872431 RepID=UPI0025B9B3C0|nr:hypothetical protein [Algiphilus sp.]MCK5772020.1 hypothetical protein [Algiphilus sp.]
MRDDAISQDDVLWALRRHVGSEQGASAAALVTEIRGTTTPGHERQLRHRIEELRRAGQHICGHPSSGYFMAADESELVRTCAYLTDRAMTTLIQVAAMRRVSLPDLRGQLRLPDPDAHPPSKRAGGPHEPPAGQQAVP